MILRFQKQRESGLWYLLCDRDVSTRCTQRWNAPERPVWWGHYRSGTYGQLRQQSNSKIYEKLMDHGAIDEDTKFIDLGSGTMMWCLHMALKTGKPVKRENGIDL
jgi:hypothetical protein